MLSFKVKVFTQIWAVTIGMLAAGAVSADVRLPRLIGDGMVLQRDSKIQLWGWADPTEKVKIDFHGDTVTVKANRRGHWSAMMGPYISGGPYELLVSGKNHCTLHDVLIGDVWLASGQSNMQFPIESQGQWRASVDNVDQELAGAHFPKIRLFMAEHKVGLSPQSDIVSKDAWRAVTPSSVGSFSAVAYFFGRELYQRYNVPIGLIETSWGGTLAEAWTSEDSLKKFPEFHESIASLKHANKRAAVAQAALYENQRDAWFGEHGTEDRGRLDGRALWADPAFDASAWPTIEEPQVKEEDALKGFDGVVWFRREIDMRQAQAGTHLRVHLPLAGQSDITYFNGQMIGATQGWPTPRDYDVPAERVKPGRNILVVRATGSDGIVGLFGEANEMSVVGGYSTVPLAGIWSYQPGPDLIALPKPSSLTRLHRDPDTPTVLFNGMIHPMTNFKIKGVIWYQGEANVGRAAQYRRLFPTLIKDWRYHWGYDMPFLFVQLAGYGHNETEPAEYPRAELREAQSMTLSLPRTGMATAIDIGDENDIHPTDKQDVAHRLALSAARVAYGESIVDSGPVYRAMRIEGNKIRIEFSSLGSGLLITDKYGYVRGFEIAAADGKFQWAQALPDGPDIVVYHPSVPHPIAVRYDWSNTPDGNVYNREDLPAVPFRTDAPK